MGTKSETLLGVGRALVGMACTMAVIFGTEINCHLNHFSAIGQIFLHEIFRSTGTRRLLDEKGSCLGSWGSTSLIHRISEKYA